MRVFFPENKHQARIFFLMVVEQKQKQKQKQNKKETHLQIQIFLGFDIPLTILPFEIQFRLDY